MVTIAPEPSRADPAREALLDRVFGALAHPTRRALMTRLAREGSASVSELAEPFDVSLMAVSKHLSVMEDAGLLHREKDGRIRRCSLDPAPVEAAVDWIERHRVYWEGRLDALAEYLEKDAAADRPPGEPDDEPDGERAG